jgi:hypothetical protein
MKTDKTRKRLTPSWGCRLISTLELHDFFQALWNVSLERDTKGIPVKFRNSAAAVT